MEEYPENIAERGVPQDTFFECVLNTFLDGLINYTKVFGCQFQGWLVIEKGCDTLNYHDVVEIEQLRGIYRNHAHGKLSVFSQSEAYVRVAILSSTQNSFWVFLYDPDTSDCCIGRTASSRTSWQDFTKTIQAYLKTRGVCMRLDNVSGWTGW